MFFNPLKSKLIYIEICMFKKNKINISIIIYRFNKITNWLLIILLETRFIVTAAKGKIMILARIPLSCSKVIINSSLFFFNI